MSDLVLVYLPHLDSKLYTFFFSSIPYSLRNFLTKFENFSQPAQSVRNQLSRFIRFWLEFIMRTLSNSELLSLFFHISLIWTRNHELVFFFLIPYSLRIFLTKFESFSQSAQFVGNRLSRFVKFFMGSLIST